MNDSVRNPAATTTGASVALVLAWVWNDIMAVQYKWPAMPEAVVVVLSVFVVDVAREWMTRRAPVPAVAPASPVGRRSPAEAVGVLPTDDRRLAPPNPRSKPPSKATPPRNPSSIRERP